MIRPAASLFVEYFGDRYGMGRHYRGLVGPLTTASDALAIDLRVRRLGRPGVPFRLARLASSAGGPWLGMLSGSGALVHTSLAIPPWSGPPKQVRSFHDTVSLDYPEELALPPWTAEALDAADAIMTVSRFSAERIDAAFPGTLSKCCVIPPGVDEVFYPSETERHGVLVVAGASRRKNLATILSAWPSVWNACHEPLVVVGQAGPHQEGVEWKGYVDDAELAGLYRSSRVVLVPSLHEGFGLPVVEAMASGTPVIASRSSSLPEVADGAALLVDPTDPDAWATAVRDLLDSPTAASRLSEAGIARASVFTWKAAAASLAGVYRRLLDQG